MAPECCTYCRVLRVTAMRIRNAHPLHTQHTLHTHTIPVNDCRLAVTYAKCQYNCLLSKIESLPLSNPTVDSAFVRLYPPHKARPYSHQDFDFASSPLNETRQRPGRAAFKEDTHSSLTNCVNRDIGGDFLVWFLGLWGIFFYLFKFCFEFIFSVSLLFLS